MVGGAWTYDAANDQEPDYDVHGLGHLRGVFADLTIDGDLIQKFPADRQVEDSPDSDRSEEANKCCLVEVLDLVYELVHGENDGHSSN